MQPSTQLGLAAVLACATATAFAAHPLQTEDTGTQGSGNVEWENGLSWTRVDGGRVFAYQPQVSVGVTPAIDLIVQPSWLRSSSGDGSAAQGLGDTNLDIKWRFAGSAPWSLGVRAGEALATSQHGLGQPHGDLSTHGLLAATWDAAPWTVHANVGMVFNPANSGERTHIGVLSAAAMWAASQCWTFTADIDGSANPDPHHASWPVTLLAGAIYTVRPGLDLDAGYQSGVRTASSAPSTVQWLVGITYRFAP